MDSDVSITDVDDTNITGATITLTNDQTGDTLAIDSGSLPGGISVFSSTATEIVLTGSASLSDYEAALKASGLDFKMHSYTGTKHGFHNNSTLRYNEAAAKLAWERTIAFFD